MLDRHLGNDTATLTPARYGCFWRAMSWHCLHSMFVQSFRSSIRRTDRSTAAFIPYNTQRPIRLAFQSSGVQSACVFSSVTSSGPTSSNVSIGARGKMHSLCRLSPRERASDWLSVLDPGLVFPALISSVHADAERNVLVAVPGPLLSANIWPPQLLASLRRRGHVPRTMSRRRLEE